jgi:hypothetical protein
VEEIQRRMQMPLTKQDSYANAIYMNAVRRGGGGGGNAAVRKQGSYEAAVESGLNAQAAIQKNRQIQKMRKQVGITKPWKFCGHSRLVSATRPITTRKRAICRYTNGSKWSRSV